LATKPVTEDGGVVSGGNAVVGVGAGVVVGFDSSVGGSAGVTVGAVGTDAGGVDGCGAQPNSGSSIRTNVMK
jgi:hypothetical protein